MKEKIINYIFYIIITAVICFLCYKIYQYHVENNELQESLEILENQLTISPTIKKIDSFVSNNIEHNIYEEETIDNLELKKKLATSKGFIDSITKILDIQSKDIISAQKVIANLNIKNQKLEKLSEQYLEYKNKYLKLLVDIENETFDLDYNVYLNTVEYKKRTKFLMPKQRFIDIYSEDSNVTINNYNRFTVHPEKPKRFGIGFQVGVTANIDSLRNLKFKPTPYIGIGLSYDIIQF